MLDPENVEKLNAHYAGLKEKEAEAKGLDLKGLSEDAIVELSAIRQIPLVVLRQCL